MRRRVRPQKRFFVFISILILLGTGLYLAYHSGLVPHSYTAAHFGIETVYSTVDFNADGADDYTGILLGAREDAENHPRYDDRYWDAGYPPDDIGVCSDVVWRAFRNAGYCLRDMVDADIAARPGAYPRVTERDDHIDFRRVKNLRVFFDTYAVSLSLDPDEIDAWQPGDIVIWGDDKHIGIVSDKRNSAGQAYVIHNAGQPRREEDALTHWDITGHYRFDASRIDPDVLVAWHE